MIVGHEQRRAEVNVFCVAAELPAPNAAVQVAKEASNEAVVCHRDAAVCCRGPPDRSRASSSQIPSGRLKFTLILGRGSSPRLVLGRISTRRVVTVVVLRSLDACELFALLKCLGGAPPVFCFGLFLLLFGSFYVPSILNSFKVVFLRLKLLLIVHLRLELFSYH